MKLALRAHNASTMISVYVLASATIILAGEWVIPIDLDRTRAPRPMPLVEIVSILVYFALMYLASSQLRPFDVLGPRSRIIRLAETAVPAVAAILLSLGGASFLQSRLDYTIQWETIVINTVAVIGVTLIATTVFPMEPVVIAVLATYFGFAILQSLLDPPLAQYIPLTQMSPTDHHFGIAITFAVILLLLGTAMHGIFQPTQRPQR